jgi:ribonuclease Z
MDDPALCSAIGKLSPRIRSNPAMRACVSYDTGDEMRVTVLGTGTPYPEPQRFGPAILVEAASQKMPFDCGRGAVIRLSENGVPVEAVRDVYLTHLHSDHVTGLPDLWLTGWFLGRKEPLRVWARPEHCRRPDI